jgi:hypothetical protein
MEQTPMPITRRRRANPPEQPESNNHLAEQNDHAVEVLAAEQLPFATTDLTGTTEQTELEGNADAESEAESLPEQPAADITPYQVMESNLPPTPPNGDRSERTEVMPPAPPIEGGRRTARGELFRRPPLPPAMQSPTVPATAVQLQPPSHEITLPLGKKPGDTHGDPLHLAYNPGYTGADEVRSALLHKLAQESKSGGRARCWSCGSIAIVYDRWNTRSKSFGEIGIAFCEICGVWSVM